MNKILNSLVFVNNYYSLNVEFVDIDLYNRLLNEEYDNVIDYIDDVIVIKFDNL